LSSSPGSIDEHVIQPLENSPAPEAQQQATTATAAKPADTDFVAKLHAAAARAKPAADKPESTNPTRERVAVPEGETWASTKPGAHYARIITGPRTGQYINLTHGERRGETFTIENRDGKKLHVYGESGTEVTIKPSVDASATTEAAKRVKHPPSDRPAKGERWAPVEGHNNYADILEGPRNGLYVNISGGVRDGMAFQIVKKGEKVFHVYGTGKDKQMIQVEPKDKDKKDDDKKADRTPAASGTGGTGAVTGGSTASGDSADAPDPATDVAANGTGGTAAP
jgi:hypothetical protein